METQHSESKKKCHEQKPVHIHIFVNHRRFDESDGVNKKMNVSEIAKLVGVAPDAAIVRRLMGHKYGEPLSGDIKVKPGDRFVVTRRRVDGGYDNEDRIGREVRLLEEGGQRVKRLAAPDNAVIYLQIPVLKHPDLNETDVLVRPPSGYPSAMLDHAWLPDGSPLIGKVKGSPQDILISDGRKWRKISYHPHGNGGAGPWDPRIHGFHTYFSEILSWLEDMK